MSDKGNKNVLHDETKIIKNEKNSKNVTKIIPNLSDYGFGIIVNCGWWLGVGFCFCVSQGPFPSTSLRVNSKLRLNSFTSVVYNPIFLRMSAGMAFLLSMKSMVLAMMKLLVMYHTPL